MNVKFFRGSKYPPLKKFDLNACAYKASAWKKHIAHMLVNVNVNVIFARKQKMFCQQKQSFQENFPKETDVNFF